MVSVKGVTLNVKSINIKRIFSMETLHSHLIQASPCIKNFLMYTMDVNGIKPLATQQM